MGMVTTFNDPRQKSKLFKFIESLPMKENWARSTAINTVAMINESFYNQFYFN